MDTIWRFLSGEVPGGFAVPLVLIVVFFPILEYIYRTGNTMGKPVYRRLRWSGPVVILVVYTLVWLQSPPKTEPVRIAVVADISDESIAWQVEAITDLAARSLKKTSGKVIINPWAGAIREYDMPDDAVLKQAGYLVYRIEQARGAQSVILLVNPNNEVERFSLVDFNPFDFSRQITEIILKDIGKAKPPAQPFSHNLSIEALRYYYQGIVHFNGGRINSSRQHFQKALEIDSTFIPGQLKLAQSLERGDNVVAAEIEFIRALQSDVNSVEAMVQVGEFFLRHLDWTKAEAPLKLALTEDPFTVRTYLGLARIHEERLKDLRLDNRIRLLEEAIRLDPAFENARIALADHMMKTTVAYRVAGLIEAGLEINPESAGLLLKKGAIELYDGELESARKTYEKILEFDSQNATAKYNLGVVGYKVRDFENAEQNFRQSLGLGGSVDGYYYLGMIYMQREEKEKARQFFEKRWEMRKTDDEAFAVKAKELAEQLNNHQ